MKERTSAFTVGVLADTHIPDRVRGLHPAVLPVFRAAGVCHILHAGDISVPSVLDTLREIAPVTAVRGNRDLLFGPKNMAEVLRFGAVRVALIHGHGGWIPYLRDKVKFLLHGYQFSRYLPRLMRMAASAEVVVFGHTHNPEIYWQDGRLLFNPGSACYSLDIDEPPSVGLLRVCGEIVEAQVVPLEGWRMQRREWVAV